MNKIKKVILSMLLIYCATICYSFASTDSVLWSDKPVVLTEGQIKTIRYAADNWSQNTFPIGNGRLGCTVFGDPSVERIQFNEDSLWVGNEYCTGGYQPFGDLYIELSHKNLSNYRRELDISKALQTVSYDADGVSYKREYFSSYPSQVMVYRFSANKKGMYTGNVYLNNLHNLPTQAEKDTLIMKGKNADLSWWKVHLTNPKKLMGQREYTSDKIIPLDFEARVKVVNEGGQLSVSGNKILFKNCDALTFYLVADTSYLNDRKKGWQTEHPHKKLVELLEDANDMGFDKLLKEHIIDYQELYNRFTLDLGSKSDTYSKMPTATRLAKYKEEFKLNKKSEDRGLESLMYQYARYLMIACSRPGEGGLPANLQGLWLYKTRPDWRCDYHTDINLQMNYWFVDQANLSECFTPLAEWVNSIREVRKEETLKVLGVKRGWLMRSENNVFGGSTYLIQKGDSAWISQNLWDHYAFTQDITYLKKYAYPVMKEISEFWVDHLKELPNGYLVAPDGTSPEHGPKKVDGVSYDQQLCWDLFTNTIEASEVLGIDKKFRAELKQKKKKLLGPKIGKWGQLQEWMEDIDDPKSTHRHVSHMLAVYPGRQIHPTTTSKLAKAAKVSVVARGNGRTGWSKIFKSCVFARLLDGDKAYALLSDVLLTKTYGNLWATHPPFQIDCNFGYAAAVNEMLVQSHLGEIHILPALPKIWQNGSVKGMKIRGGYLLNMDWKDGKLNEVSLKNITSVKKKITLRYGEKLLNLDVAKNMSYELHVDDFN